MDLERRTEKRQWVRDFRSGLRDQQLMDKYGLSVRELSLLITQALSMGILTESDIYGNCTDRPIPARLEDSRRFSRRMLDFTLVARKVPESDNTGEVTDICERGFQLMGLSAAPGERTDLEIVTDWCSQRHSILLEAACRWSSDAKKAHGRKAGFEVIAVKRGNFQRLLDDVSPLCLSQIELSALKACPGADSNIDSDRITPPGSWGYTQGSEGMISRVRLFKLLDILPIPCMLIDQTGHLVHVNKYSATISPTMFDLTGVPFSSIFLEEEGAAKVKGAAATRAVVQATLRIEDTPVPCSLESRALGSPGSPNLLVFLKPFTINAASSPSQTGDAQNSCGIMPEASPTELPAGIERPVTCVTSRKLSADFGETFGQPGASSSPDVLERQIDRDSADCTTVSPGASVVGCQPSGIDLPDAGEKEHPFAAQGWAVNSIVGLSEPFSTASNETRRQVAAIERFRSKVMQEVLEECRVAAQSEGIVLLLGESGSGKDYLARFIHDHSLRSEAPFRSVNCAAIPEQLAESEFFGHEEGAFTGAHMPRKGILELAPRGTLLLNEIGELPMALQAKLLTFLDSGRFFRVGGQSEVSTDSRILAATNQNLRNALRNGSFRADLFYRLNVVPIRVPPLRERIEDLPILIEELTADLAQRLRLNTVPTVDRKTLAGLRAYHWPGNVRELRNRLERTLGLSGGKKITLALMFNHNSQEQWELNLRFPVGSDLNNFKKEAARRVVTEALVRAGGKRQVAAKLLGITRYSLKRHMTNLGLMGNGNDHDG